MNSKAAQMGTTAAIVVIAVASLKLCQEEHLDFPEAEMTDSVTPAMEQSGGAPDHGGPVDPQRPDGQRPDGQRPDGQRPDGQRPDLPPSPDDLVVPTPAAGDPGATAAGGDVVERDNREPSGELSRRLDAAASGLPLAARPRSVRWSCDAAGGDCILRGTIASRAALDDLARQLREAPSSGTDRPPQVEIGAVEESGGALTFELALRLP